MSARVKRALEAAVRWLFFRRYGTAKAYYHFLLRRAERRKRGTPVLVYQMGKVGSRTVVAALRQAGLPAPVYHVHRLAEEQVRREEDLYRTRWNKGGGAAHLWRSQLVRRRLETGAAAGKWNVVTLVREPVARNVSDFFQVGPLRLGFDHERAVAGGVEAAVEEVRRRFLEAESVHEVPLTWFDTELKAVFGIDVYAVPFERARGYQLYENERARVLLIRLEDLRACAPAAFEEFLGLEGFTLGGDVNRASELPWAELYRSVLAAMRLPSEYLARMYDSTYARHFYSDEELKGFRRRWERPAVPIRS